MDHKLFKAMALLLLISLPAKILIAAQVDENEAQPCYENYGGNFLCGFFGLFPLGYGIARLVHYYENCPTPPWEYDSWCAEGPSAGIWSTAIGGGTVVAAACLGVCWKNIKKCLKDCREKYLESSPDDINKNLANIAIIDAQYQYSEQ